MFNSDYFSVVSEAGNAQVTVADNKQTKKNKVSKTRARKYNPYLIRQSFSFDLSMPLYQWRIP